PVADRGQGYGRTRFKPGRYCPRKGLAQRLRRQDASQGGRQIFDGSLGANFGAAAGVRSGHQNRAYGRPPRSGYLDRQIMRGTLNFLKSATYSGNHPPFVEPTVGLFSISSWDKLTTTADSSRSIWLMDCAGTTTFRPGNQ